MPEINADDVDGHRGILSIPNCSTTPLAMVLDALRAEAGIERVLAADLSGGDGPGQRW